MIADAGETVTCQNGHYICRIAAPIFRGEHASKEQFADWRPAMPPLETNRTIPLCPACGADWLRLDGEGGRICIDGEWRS